MDETICISQKADAMNRLLAAIEEEAELYRMRLNKNKREFLVFETKRKIKFRDGVVIKPSEEVKYLGCYLNNKADGSKDLNRRCSECMATLKHK